MNDSRNIILLDLDGVLITTPSWRADQIHADAYADFNEKAVNNFNRLLQEVNADIWLTSSRRKSKSLSELNEIFRNRDILKGLTGVIPFENQELNRLEEITSFLSLNPVRNYLILDDDNSLENLSQEKKAFWVKTYLIVGFSQDKLEEALEKVKMWW